MRRRHLWRSLCVLAAAKAFLAVRTWWAPGHSPTAFGCSGPCRRQHLRHGVLRRAEEVKGPRQQGSTAEDWRDFRARLVQQELNEQGAENGSALPAEAAQGWAHTTPLIEQGSVLLSAPGDHFAINQQYFHKAVILIIQHDSGGDVGLILNRPTAFSTEDLTSAIIGENAQNWNVWFGGDCEGLNGASGDQVPFCLHTREDLAELSGQVIRGVYLIDFARARELVDEGRAEREDFLLLMGYCGWGRGQMQSELDRGDTWTLAAADQRALLGELRNAQASLTARLAAAAEERRRAESSLPLGAADVGDGLQDWQRLYLALGPKFQSQLETARADGDDSHSDDMLRRWIERCLIPLPLKSPAAQKAAAYAAAGEEELPPLSQGTILRGSATAWLLGKPEEDEDFGSRNFVPGQYLHKSVTMLLRDIAPQEPCVLALLNGPVIGRTGDGGEVLFGGINSAGNRGAVYEVASGDVPLRVQGLIVLGRRQLAKLLKLQALEVAEGTTVEDIAKVPVAERWRAAGGQLNSLFEASAELIGNVQRRKWYRRFLDISLEEG